MDMIDSSEWVSVRYWLDDGLWTPAVIIGDSVVANEQLLVVNLDTEAGRTVIGKAMWFSADYVAHWHGLVPETAAEGTQPGQWSRYP